MEEEPIVREQEEEEPIVHGRRRATSPMEEVPIVREEKEEEPMVGGGCWLRSISERSVGGSSSWPMQAQLPELTDVG